ncbi:hypothetical protein [Bacillus kexueae]|nr:hypothetical protein [Bacillus kexueae]
MIWGFVIGVWAILVLFYLSIFKAAKQADEQSQAWLHQEEDEKKL